MLCDSCPGQENLSAIVRRATPPGTQLIAAVQDRGVSKEDALKPKP